MVFESIVPVLAKNWFLVIPIVLVAYLTSNYFNHGLNKYPGPLLAGLTDWWRFFDVYGRRPEITHIKLHREHGDVVRLGPNSLSFADPKAIKQIYGLNKGFVKSGFYPVQMAVSRGQRLPSLFSTTDESYHANLRRSVNSAFSMSALVQYEPFVDEVTKVFLDQTDRLFATRDKICNFAEWLQYYAFDVIGQITYSRRHGFVDRAEDVDGMVAYLGKLFSYVAPVSCPFMDTFDHAKKKKVGQIPWLDFLFLKNPVLLLLDRLGFKLFAFPITTFAKTNMNERLVEMAGSKSGGQEEMRRRGDLLSMFLKAQADRPDFMTDERVLVMAVSMAFAGSETTAISLAAVFYYLLKNPRCYYKLKEEIQAAVETGTIENRPDGIVTWAESQKLPYLDACIKEAFRMHPAAGLPLERVTPPQGVEICGQHIPGGTIVGCSAWAIHRRKEIYGDDVDHYRPERWLEAEKEQLKEMNACMLQFGAGPRTCIGKNISLLEVYKLVPSFLRRFEVKLAFPTKEWRLHNAWFVKQNDFDTLFTARQIP